MSAPNVSVSFDSTQMRELLGEAILAQISAESREKIIGEAVQKLLESPKDNYGRTSQPSPLQHAFNMAIGQVANQVAQELVAENPEIKARVKQAANEAMAKLLEDWDTTQTLTDILRTALREK